MFFCRVILCLSFFSQILWGGTSGWCASPVEEFFQEARQDGRFVLPGQEEVTRAEVLFARLLQGETAEQLSSPWHALGYKIQDISQDGKELVVLMEEPLRKEGRGFFLFRRSNKASHMLMIPHGFKDVRTDVIGLALFMERDFTVGAWNTVPRYKNREDKSLQQDFGKQPSSYFSALTRAFAGSKMHEKVYQLHGFSTKKRESAAGKKAGVILSGGSGKVRQDVRTLGHCLQAIVAEPVLLYPSEVHELGGTTNISGKILRNMGHGGFVHIELSRPLRQRLSKDSDLSKSFGSCLETL